MPQTMLPSGHSVPAVVPSAPQPSWQVASAAQVNLQSPSHLMSQTAVSLHVMVLPAPMFSLQSAVPEHVAVESAPAFSSHLLPSMQLIELPTPPLPLHSELS
jgi:hypothetical protein